ncbi:MAG TPA: AfsR/SARP family transcriptional regulator [Micromonosporaceae bacterium]|nr:AfsR/SARP family transcriptional regulator [Micromonosporaceae bacterium]
MRYEILGKIRVVDGATVSTVSARKIEILLAVLLIRSGQVVGTTQLMTEIWGEHPPRRATAGLHVYVSQLRKFLSRPGSAGSPIVTTPPGYLLQLGSDELDVQVFQHLVDQGRSEQRAGCIEEACASFGAALNLWRGPALGDLRDGPLVNGFAGWAEQARLECTEKLVDGGLMLGRHRELASYLYTLTIEYPLREVFYQQLMLALYRSGCLADALKVYQSARAVLMDELGLEPCRSLRDLQRAILLGDPALELAAAQLQGAAA